MKIVYLETAPGRNGAELSSRYADTDVTGVVVYKGLKRNGEGAMQLPTPGDPIQAALAKVDPPKPAAQVRPAGEVPTRRSDVPWVMILVTLVLLALIGGVLWMLSLQPAS